VATRNHHSKSYRIYTQDGCGFTRIVQGRTGRQAIRHTRFRNPELGLLSAEEV